MTRYSNYWVVAATALAVLGLAAALVLWTAGGVLLVVLAVATFVGLVVTVAAGPHAEAAPAEWAPRRVLRVSLGCGLGVVCVLGPVAKVGWPWLLLWALVAAASPPSLRLLRRRLTSSDRPDPRPPEPATDFGDGTNPRTDTDADDSLPVSAEQLGTLDVRTLCWVWRRSLVALQRSTSPAQTLRAAALREQLLDELGRRYPDRLDAWLASGAIGDPGPYVIDR